MAMRDCDDIIMAAPPPPQAETGQAETGQAERGGGRFGHHGSGTAEAEAKQTSAPQRRRKSSTTTPTAATATSRTPLLADPDPPSADDDDSNAENKKNHLHQSKHRYPLRYHLLLITRQAPKLCNFLIHGTPIWLFKLMRLMAFVVALLPAFVVFAYYYFVSADRVSVAYKEGAGATSRHFLDIYGSSTRTTSGSAEKKKKPVVIFLTGGAWIIGYKMWGALLARTLSLPPFDVLVIIPDYRNFPQVRVGDMVNDVDLAIEWVLEHCDEWGGDGDRVVLVGQSAGAHLGNCVLLGKALDELREMREEKEKEAVGPPPDDATTQPVSTTSYKASDLRGFISTSGPYDLIEMRDVFHRHGLDRNIVTTMFGNDIKRFSPVHMLAECRREVARSLEGNKGDFDCDERDDNNDDSDGILGSTILPPIHLTHGTSDQTVPYRGAIEYASLLNRAKVRVTTQLYENWSHTDPILEKPMGGVHTFHRDVYELVGRWTATTITEAEAETETEVEAEPRKSAMVPPFDESIPQCKRICPGFLIEIGRFFNPF